MRRPLIRQGQGPAAAYDLARRQRQADAQALARITDQVRTTPNLDSLLSRLGDEHQLRGIPVQARGVRGAVRGTNPGDGLANT